MNNRKATGHGPSGGPCFLCSNPAGFEDGVGGFRIGKGEYSIKFCRACGLGRTVPFPDPRELAEVYSSEAYREEDATRFPAPLEKLIRYLREGRARAVERHAKPGRILDVGCGRGDFPAMMAARGWEAAGCDLDERIKAGKRNVPGVELKWGPIEAQDFPSGHFDAITFWHSFEHVPNPMDALGAAGKMLKPGGLLVVSVPNAGSMQARASGANWFHLDAPFHLYHYSADNLGRLLRAEGFDVVNVNHFSLEYNPYGWLQSIYNMMGFRRNLLYDFLRSQDISKGARFAHLGVLLNFIMMPVALPVSLALSAVEALLSSGGTIDVFARKRA